MWRRCFASSLKERRQISEQQQEDHSPLRYSRFLPLRPSQLHIAAIAYPNLLCNSKMRQCQRLRRTLLIKDLTAVSTMMFTIGEREWCSTPETDIGINPFRCCLSIDHRRVRSGKVWGWEVEAYTCVSRRSMELQKRIHTLALKTPEYDPNVR